MKKEDSIKKYFHIFNLNVSEYNNVSDSNSSQVYILTLENREKVVLKIPFNSQKLQRERKALEILNGKVPVPEIIKAYNGDNLTKGALLLSYINGKPLKGNITKELSYEIGEMKQ